MKLDIGKALTPGQDARACETRRLGDDPAEGFSSNGNAAQAMAIIMATAGERNKAGPRGY